MDQDCTGTLLTIAKDVKIQVEFNPNTVEAFRLIGYENRVLAHRDFNDDKKDAGDIGAGHRVTALYEVVPKGGAVPDSEGQATSNVDPLKYQKPGTTTGAANRSELMTVKLRYKTPSGATSQLLTRAVNDSQSSHQRASIDFQFAAAVAEFGMLLRTSPHRGNSSFQHVSETAARLENSRKGWSELLRLVQLPAVGGASDRLVRGQ